MRQFCLQIANQAEKLLKLQVPGLADHICDPPSVELGDLSLPCFPLAKQLQKSPASIAEQLAGESWDLPWIESVAQAGPYLNFKVRSAEFSREALTRVLDRAGEWGNSTTGQGSTVLVEYSSPNIAKQLAIHHMRSTMLGQATANLLRSVGFSVVCWNHLGDWGTTFGKLLAAWDHFQSTDDLDSPVLENRSDPVSDLNSIYVAFNEAIKENPALEDVARDWFRKLEQGDQQARERWQRIRNVSFDRFNSVYQRLGVSFDEVIGESFYETQMNDVVQQLADSGLLEESEGAQIVRLSDDIPPMLIRKQDGATLYGTRDLASAIERYRRFQFDRCLYFVDAGQSLHFRQVFGVIEKLGYDWANQLEHAEFGVMRLNVEGSWKKGKTRGGQVVLLEEVLDKAVQLASAIVKQKNPDLPTDELDQISEAVGVGAVVFSDMKAARRKDVNFDLDKILSFDGETGPYLQYTHVRFCSILTKAADQGIETGDGSRLDQPEEITLLKRVLRFPDVIERAARDAEPSQVSQYLLELASEFNTYYAKHRVIGEDLQLSGDRLALIGILRTTMKRGLQLLCIQPIERM
ncbi:MAG: arginine--tRNA ligase [Planctomycetota bacterium]